MLIVENWYDIAQVNTFGLEYLNCASLEADGGEQVVVIILFYHYRLVAASEGGDGS